MANKIQERVYLECFLKRADIVCTDIHDVDPPDFYVTYSSKRIAVEVTNIYIEPNPGRKGSKSKRQESLRGQWLRQLSLDYYEECKIPINVKISFPCSEELQTDISCEVLTVLHKSAELTDWEWKTYKLECDRKIVEIDIHRLSGIADFEGYSRWTCITDRIGEVAPISEDHINNALQKKEKKLETYRSDCDEVWLLLVIDKSWKSGKLLFDDKQLALKNTAFDSVWLLEYPIKTHNLLC